MSIGIHFNRLLHASALTAVVSILIGSWAAKASPPSIQEITEGLRKNEVAIFDDSTSFELLYARVSSEDVIKTTSSGGQLLMRWHIAHMRPDAWFAQSAYLQAQSKTGVTLSPTPVTVMVRNGMCLDWSGGNSVCYIDPNSKTTDYLKGWYYFQYLGFDVYSKLMRSIQVDSNEVEDYLNKHDDPFLKDLREPFLLPSLTANGSKYSVRPTPETVDGHECWVVEWPGVQQFWVDPATNFSVRRRVVNWALDKPIKYDVKCSDMREVKPGLWLPFSLTVDNYTRLQSEDEKLWGSVANRSTYKTERMDFNQDIERLFTVDLPAGVMVNDFARQLFYRVPPDGGDPFEEPLTIAREQLQRPVNRWLTIINAAVVAVLILLVAIRWRRSKAASVVVLLTLGTFQPGAGAAVNTNRACSNEASTQEIMSSDRASFDTQMQPTDADGIWLKWKPKWRSQQDCGPNSLFILLKLLGTNVGIEHVRNLVRIDPQSGCSIEALRKASEQLGTPLKVKFVGKDAFDQLNFPVIMHGNSSVKGASGHFCVVIGHDTSDGRYSIIDPVQERYGKYHEKSLLLGYSGYVLVPDRPFPLMPLASMVIGIILLLAPWPKGLIDHFTMILAAKKGGCSQPTS